MRKPSSGSGKLWTTATVISRNFNWQDAIMPAEGFPGTRKKTRELLSRAIEDGLPEDLYPNWF